MWIGLRGWATDSVQTWAGFPLTRDTSPPAVFITSPTGANVSRPVLQLQAYSTEPLASIRYDLTNECGLVTNLEGYVTHQWFDTNTMEFTTNWFECLDIPLTNGDNTINLYATDRAGNLSTNVYTYVLDYSGVTDPPALLLYWPQDRAQVSGTNFTLRGLLDDPTATVTAEITDADNVTFQVEGLVERNGLLWVEDLPLGPGTNTLSLTMSNAAGLSSSTNLSVIQSDVVLTIADLSGADLNHPPIPVSGSISADGYTVWVNGVEVTTVWPNGDGTWGWQVEGVPVNEGGTAVIQARAIPNTDNEGQGTGGGGGISSTMADPGNPASPEAPDVEADPEKEPEVVQVHYDIKRTDIEVWVPGGGFGKILQTIEYDLDQPGHASYSDCHGVPSDEEYSWWEVAWDSHGREAAWGPYGGDRGPDVCGLFDPSGYGHQSVQLGSEFCKVNCSRPMWSESGAGRRTRARTAKAQYELRTGGKSTSQRQNLFVGTAPVRGVGNYFFPEVDQDPELSGSYDVAPEKIELGDLGRLGSDGRVYKVLADNATRDITPVVKGNPYYRYYAPSATKHKPIIWACTAILDPDKVVSDAKFCVGQHLSFNSSWSHAPGYDGTPPGIQNPSYDWVMSDKYVNRKSEPNSAGCVTYDINPDALKQWFTTLWYVSGPSNKNVRLTLDLSFDNGQSARVTESGKFKVFRPTVSLVPFGTSPSFFPNYHGAVPGIQLGGDGDPRDGHHEMAYYVHYDLEDYLGTGTGGIVQLLTADYSARPSLIFSDWRLDGNSVLYSSAPIDPFANPPQNEVPFDDEPSNYQPFIFSTIWVKASFQDYCVFKPHAGSPNQNIFVTLGVITWSCDGELSQIHMGEPGFPGIKVTRDDVVGPDGPVESDQFPTWEKDCPEGGRQ